MVDASKFFYQFRTHPEDRKYLGTVHPADDTSLYVYAGLPMGAAISPALAGRYGLAFVRLLLERSELFQGRGRDNCWWTGFRPTGEYDAKLGYGFVLIGRDGLPAVRVWVHVDDFAIHGPTYAKTAAELRFFLDQAANPQVYRLHSRHLRHPLPSRSFGQA